MTWRNAEKTYEHLFAVLAEGGTPGDVADWLNDFWSMRAANEGDLRTFEHGGAEYLFELPDREAQLQSRTVGVCGFAEHPAEPREITYQAAFPLVERDGRAVDRGHLMPYSGAGLYGPNIFRQDRALNRGLSDDGRGYRILENRSVKSNGFYFCALRYCDDSDDPAVVETGVVVDGQLEVRAYRNRFDPLAIAAFPYSRDPSARMEHRLAEMGPSEIGDVGEEVVRVIFEADESAQIIAMGDSRMPRDEGRQDLDAVVLIDGVLVAVEVKARYHSGRAGTLTRAGNLRRPRLRRGRRGVDDVRSPAQLSGEYVGPRVAQFVEAVDGELDARVYLVDLRAALVQWFPVTPEGRLRSPVEPPRECSQEIAAALQALDALS